MFSQELEETRTDGREAVVSQCREFYPRIARCLEYVGREEEEKGEVGGGTKAI